MRYALVETENSEKNHDSGSNQIRIEQEMTGNQTGGTGRAKGTQPGRAADY